MSAQMAASEARLAAMDAAIAEQQEMTRERNKRLDEIAAERNALLAAVNEAKDLRRIIAEKEPYLQIASNCWAAADALKTVEPLLKQYQEEAAELIEKHAEAAKEAAEAEAEIPEKLDIAPALRARISTYRRQITEYATQRGQISAKLSAIEDAEKQITALRGDIERAALTLNDYTTLTQAFGLDGIQYMIIRGVVPEIIGPWGQRHLRYIKEHREGFYTGLLLSGKLNSYLADVDRQAQEQLDTIIRQMAQTQGVTEALKAADPMAWVGRMNDIRNQAAEVVCNDLIYR